VWEIIDDNATTTAAVANTACPKQFTSYPPANNWISTLISEEWVKIVL
jgi:hypothetical protein